MATRRRSLRGGAEAIRLVALAALLLTSAGCLGRRPAPPRAKPPTAAEWNAARGKLTSLRAQAAGEGAAGRTLRLAVKLREPMGGRVLEARGAVATLPPDALRMILLGPGGTTALDLWAKGGSFRFAVPALDLVRRGDASTPRAEMRGLPVDFLTWWLLRPFDGSLLWAAREPGADRFVLRKDDAVMTLRVADDGSVSARRTTWLAGDDGVSRPVDVETVTATRLGCGDAAYHQASTGLDVWVRCEGEERENAPDPRAFVDPDEVPEGAP